MYDFNLKWSRPELNKQKLGTFSEYYAKMALSSYGMNIYTSEVDDHGIDFIAESPKGILKFQVKSVRQGSGYVFMREEYFDNTDESLYLILVLLIDDQPPILYIIPATDWEKIDSKAIKGQKVLVYHAYTDTKSKPEFGVNVSSRNLPGLEQYKLKNMVDKLMKNN